VRIESSENVLIQQTGALDILSRLDTGDTLRARVVDITANELLLKLFDGTLINAGTMTPIDAKKGELLDFIVKKQSEQSIVFGNHEGWRFKMPLSPMLRTKLKTSLHSLA